MILLTKAEVREIHRRLLEQTGGKSGIADEGLLDSALAAVAHRLHYERASLAECAATYAYHLTKNHPFLDGNKRIGAAAAEIFVQLNGGALTATNDEIVALFFQIATGSLSKDDVDRAFRHWVAEGTQ